MEESDNSDVLLECKHIAKSYNGPIVLDNVDFSIKRGEIHSLVGENGAGKSTLIKIITGAADRNSGEIWFNRTKLPMQYTRKYAENLGIAVIYQELSLIPGMTIAQNIYLAKEPLFPRTRIVDKKKLNATAQELIERYKFPLKSTDLIDTLSIAQRQLVEILKALSQNASLVIMDEPTSSLTQKEAEMLFGIIRMLRQEGISVLYISHRLEEVYALSDRVTVLRDGKVVSVLGKEEISPSEIIRLMIGHRLEDNEVRHSLPKVKGDVVLEVNHLTSIGKFTDISFQLHRGEILGVGGLVGSGRTELVRVLYGIDPFDSGTISFMGNVWEPSVRASINAGIGLIPEERRLQGILASQTVTRNIGITNLDHVAPRGVVQKKTEKKLAYEGIRLLNIKPSNPDALAGTLSGGNQQKLVLAKWLVRELQLILIDEPTVGIDIGAKEEIYEHIKSLSRQGVSVILVSSDLPELTRLSNRVLVLRKGRIIREFKECVITSEKILRAASGILEEQDEKDIINK